MVQLYGPCDTVSVTLTVTAAIPNPSTDFSRLR